jgi:hypothetical protein
MHTNAQDRCNVLGLLRDDVSKTPLWCRAGSGIVGDPWDATVLTRVHYDINCAPTVAIVAHTLGSTTCSKQVDSEQDTWQVQGGAEAHVPLNGSKLCFLNSQMSRGFGVTQQSADWLSLTTDGMRRQEMREATSEPALVLSKHAIKRVL